MKNVMLPVAKTRENIDNLEFFFRTYSNTGLDNIPQIELPNVK